MDINEVVDRVRAYFPSEYSREEMYDWCDEVSAMIAIEDRNVYASVTLFPDGNNTVLLPRGVKFENVVSVVSGGKVLKKEDIRSVTDRSIKMSNGGAVTIVYLMPYYPIRTPKYEGRVIVDYDNNSIKITENVFFEGDTLLVELGDMSVRMPVLKVDYDESLYVLTAGEGMPEGLADGTGKIERVVTDKTFCDAPYDTMYIDYLLAKIAMYQRDYEMYSQYMSSFNSRLDSYKRWLINHMPQDGGKLINWW